MRISREVLPNAPSILVHILASLDRFRQSNPTESTTTVRITDVGSTIVRRVRLKIYQRGGERIRLELPNGGMEDIADSRDIIHRVGNNGRLLGRFRADKPIPGFRVLPESETPSS